MPLINIYIQTIIIITIAIRFAYFQVSTTNKEFLVLLPQFKIGDGY